MSRLRRPRGGALVHISDVLGRFQGSFLCLLWPDADHANMKSRVHPRFKTRYRVNNWPEYDNALVSRGDVTLWVAPEAIDAWVPTASGRRGAPRKFSDMAIETALTLRTLFHLPLRQAEGFLRALLALMSLDLDAPDHTTLSRRAQLLSIDLESVRRKGAVHLIIDSTGLSIVGEGEWAAAKHGGKGIRGWRKLHVGVDRAGVIVAQILTDSSGEDSVTGVDLIEATPGKIESLTGDSAYDTRPVYHAAESRGARVIVPPTRAEKITRRKPRSVSRERTIRRVKRIGLRAWKKESGYHQQGRAENTFFRFKAILGGALRSRSWEAQVVEVAVGCKVLNRLLEIGRPVSVAIPR